MRKDFRQAWPGFTRNCQKSPTFLWGAVVRPLNIEAVNEDCGEGGDNSKLQDVRNDL